MFNYKFLKSLLLLVVLVLFSVNIVYAESQEVANWNAQLYQQDLLYRNYLNQPGGITSVQYNSIINNKKAILTQAGFGSFNSFSSFTDTQVNIMEVDAPLSLIRRGESNELTSKYGMGRWFGGQYFSLDNQRNNYAVLKSWGGSLKTIYVISVPTDKRILTGPTAPQTSTDATEYRTGGAIQYWLLNQNKETSAWLLYAVDSDTHLKSYATAITAAQKLSYSVLEDMSLHYEDLRFNEFENVSFNKPSGQTKTINETGKAAEIAESTIFNYNNENKDSVSANNIDKKIPVLQKSKPPRSLRIWVKPYDLKIANYDSNFDTTYFIQGSHVSVEKQFMGIRETDNQCLHVAAFSGYSRINSENKDYSTRNKVGGVYGGAYSVFYKKFKKYNSLGFYLNNTIMGGKLYFTTDVPGIQNLGFSQDYSGASLLTAIETGVPIYLKYGFAIEPQLELDFNKIMQEKLTDKIYAPIKLQRGASLKGRVGINIRKSLINRKKFKLISWFKANFNHEFLGRNLINIDNELGEDNQRGNYFALGGGVSIDIFKRVCMKAEMFRLLNKENGYRGNFGISFLW